MPQTKLSPNDISTFNILQTNPLSHALSVSHDRWIGAAEEWIFIQVTKKSEQVRAVFRCFVVQSQSGDNHFMVWKEFLLPNGGFPANVVTTPTTYPDGGTRVETYFRDGQLGKLTGTGVHPVRYEYGVESESGTQRACTKEIKLDAAETDTSEWVKTYRDMLGRNYKTVHSGTGSPSSEQTYSTSGQLVKSTDPDDVITSFDYNLKGERSFTAIHTNALDDDIDFDYDRITQTTNDFTTKEGYDVRRTRSYQWETFDSDTATLVSTSERSTDGLRSWTTVRGLTSSSVQSVPSATAWTVTNTAPDSSYAVSSYSSARLSAVTRYDSNSVQIASTSYTYDAHGRWSTVTDARNGSTTYTYNDADLVETVTTPPPGTGQGPQATTTYYDVSLRATSTVQADGTSVFKEYSKGGELVLTYGSRLYPVGYSYEAQGRMKTMTNWTTFESAGARVTTWNYDANRGFLASKRYPDNQGPDYTYSDADRLKTRSWARGITTTYTNNAYGDLAGIGYSDSTTPNVSYSLDRLGRRSIIKTSGSLSSSNSMLYASSGRLISESHTAGPLAGLTLTNRYDAFNRRSQVSLLTNGVSALSYDYGYDAAARLAGVTNGSYSAAYSYLENSPHISQIVYRQSATTRMTTSKQHDYLNRLLSISSTPSDGSAASYGYHYNEANQRVRNSFADGSYWRYEYDDLGQVTSGKRSWADGTPVAGQQFEYDHDDIGNRTSTKAGGDSLSGSLREADYTVNSLNQYTSRDVPDAADIIGIAHADATVTVNAGATYRKGEYFQKALDIDNSSSAKFEEVINLAVLSGVTNGATGSVFLAESPEAFTYDADGNLTNDGRWSFVWDAENRLARLEPAPGVPDGAKKKLLFEYDPQGRRISKTVSNWTGSAWAFEYQRKFVYDGWNLLGELDDNGLLVRAYLWGSDLSGSSQGAGGVGGLLAVDEKADGVQFVGYDGNGNVSLLVDASDGTQSAGYEYDPFGRTIRATGDQAENNPCRFSTKYTDDETAFLYYGHRFYNPDTGRWVSRDPIGEKGGRNLYAFVQNSPTSSVDPNGQFVIVIPVSVVIAGGAAIVIYATVRLCDIFKWRSCRTYASATLRASETLADTFAGHNGRHGEVGSDADALTHCTAACELQMDPGPCGSANYALMNIQARENVTARDGYMDYQNNLVGFVIARRSGGTPRDCFGLCLRALNDGLLFKFDSQSPADWPTPRKGVEEYEVPSQ